MDDPTLRGLHTQWWLETGRLWSTASLAGCGYNVHGRTLYYEAVLADSGQWPLAEGLQSPLLHHSSCHGPPGSGQACIQGGEQSEQKGFGGSLRGRGMRRPGDGWGGAGGGRCGLSVPNGGHTSDLLGRPSSPWPTRPERPVWDCPCNDNQFHHVEPKQQKPVSQFSLETVNTTGAESLE